jgi:hypothetical protein
MDNPSFLTDRDLFERDQERWRLEIEQARLDAGTNGSMVPWFDDAFLPYTDYHIRIFSGLVESTQRGLLINQWLATDDLGFDAWVDTFGDPTVPEEIVTYVRMNAMMTKSSLVAARKIAQAWLFEDRSPEVVESLIEELKKPAR